MMLQETLAAERAAVELAIHGRWLERWRVGLHALWRLTRDPDDTRQAFIVGAVLDRDHIAKPFLRFMMDPGGFDLMRDQPAIDSTTVDFDALAALPEGTLGHRYARHMRDNALDPDLFLSPPGAPPGIGYFAQRLRQTHDIWHVLTGLGADLPGEIALQAFMFGQFGTPAPFFTTFAGTFLCMLEDPLAARDIWRAYRRGRRAKPLLVVRWEERWDEPVDELRAQYGIEADPPAPVIARAGAYQVDDRSLLLGLYRRLFWDRLTRVIPRAVHPNLLTLACQLFAVLAAVSCAIAIGGHPVFFVLSAIGFLGALTLDNVDGAHARRTGQCSALGELLDHGLDGVTATATLVTTGLLLRVPGPMLVAISALGAMAFATVFWEQLRTGVLRLPRIGPTEGLTLLAAWEVLLAAFGDPAWLHFSLTHVTAGTALVIAFFVVHVLAVLTPMLRVKRAELLPLVAFGALQVGLALRGANAFVPAVAIGLTAADLTTHWLRLRHRGRSGPVLPSALYLAAVPFFLELVWPSPTVWAALSLAIVLADYATRLVRHGRALA